MQTAVNILAAPAPAAQPGPVDWDAVDALFRYVESPRCPDRTLNGFVVAGFATAAVVLDRDGDVDEWWRALFAGTGHDRFAPAEVRRGFEENWRAARDELARGRLRPAVAAQDDPDHAVTVADFCAGFLRALERRPEVLRRALALDVADALRMLRELVAGLAQRPRGN